ncbi:MAG: ExbD/TolR family protein [Chthoniobacteraceae bacterium]
MAGSVGSEDGDMGFQIAPMVDVVFVLLLFFMASAGAQIVEKELTINLPSGATSNSTASTPIIIDIAPNGEVSMNNQSYGLAPDRNLTALREFLVKTVEDFGGKDPVIIRPAMDSRQERIVDVLNACAAAKVTNLTFS